MSTPAPTPTPTDTPEPDPAPKYTPRPKTKPKSKRMVQRKPQEPFDPDVSYYRHSFTSSARGMDYFAVGTESW